MIDQIIIKIIKNKDTSTIIKIRNNELYIKFVFKLVINLKRLSMSSINYIRNLYFNFNSHLIGFRGYQYNLYFVINQNTSMTECVSFALTRKRIF